LLHLWSPQDTLVGCPRPLWNVQAVTYSLEMQFNKRQRQ
jgi:hypothetical protein